jgi:hypothetical protein
MIEYWSVIGRACVDGGFRKDLLDRAKKEREHTALKDLFDYLNGSAGEKLHLSRWELCDLNRILLLVSTDGALEEKLQKIEKCWQDSGCDGHQALKTQHGWALLGMAGIDSDVCATYRHSSVTSPTYLRNLFKQPPVLDLGTADDAALTALGSFLQNPDGGGQLDGLEGAIWVVPTLENQLRAALELYHAMVKVILDPNGTKARCAGGFTRLERDGKGSYRHLSSPFIGAVGSIALGKGGTLQDSKL